MAHMAITERNETLIYRLKKGNRVSILAGIVSLIAVFSLFFHPRIQAMLFPSVRLNELTKLALSVRTSRSVDPFLFWQVRDEYGSGFFTLSSDHTIFRETQELFLPPRSEWIELASYHGARVESHDYLTPWNTLPHSRYPEFLDHITESASPPSRSIFQSEDTRVFLEGKDRLVVAFIKPISEMAKVDGLYNFPDKTLEDLHGRLWANVITFKLDCDSKSLEKLTEANLVDKK